MAKNIKWLVVALVAILAFLAFRSCGPSDKYIALKATYDQAVKDASAQYAKLLEVNSLQEKVIAAKDAAIAEKDALVAQYVGKVSTLTAELRALQNAEPVQPELETQPLVINLRAQIGNLTKLYSISVSIIDAKDGIIADWSAKFDAQVTISETWKRAYDNEHRLRLMAEGLNKSLEHQAKTSRLFGKLATAGLAGAGVYILISSITK